jgi:hypothetical protein
MGMSEEQFFDCTPRHFARLRKAWLINRQGMEEARFIAFHVMKAGGYKVRRFTDIARFPWEKHVRRVQLEDWDSPAMLKFSEDADKALAILNPKAYAEYMAGKKAREEGKNIEGMATSQTLNQEPNDPEMNIDIELSFD